MIAITLLIIVLVDLFLTLNSFLSGIKLLYPCAFFAPSGYYIDKSIDIGSFVKENSVDSRE